MVTLKSLARRFLGDSGAEFVEFALAFPLLLLVVLGIIDFGILFQQYQVVVAAAREGARVAVLPNYTAADGVARAQTYINQTIMSQGKPTPLPTASVASVTVGGKCMSTVTVTASYPHDFLFLGGIGRYFGSNFGTRTLSASATMRTELVLGGACP
ncbi:MAG: pilus assembly protein [Acidobacteriaceae bacterium]|jgi:Flp pilus assembly protein TadG|nr:pilus assembly protein [Acidobacteriaceae bacterium]